MLRVGLTGGIGSGKSTVARRLVDRGAVLVDSDALAREVVAPGTDGLAEIATAFGDGVLTADGELDRPALASVVFGDADARARLNAIVHPLVRRRSDALIAQAPADAIVVQDIPLLVEGGMGPMFPLVVVVHTDAEERVRRLVGQRGMPEADARSRIAAQADDDARRAAADVWLDNSGAPEALDGAVDALWDGRLVEFESRLRRRDPVRTATVVLADPDPAWPADAARLAARISAAAGGREVAHIGSTAVPGLPAEDVIDLQLAVGSLDEAAGFRDALADVGFPRCPDVDHDDPKPPGPVRPEQCHGTADPGRRVHLHIRETGSPGWRYALLFRDWLRADPASREEYLVLQRRAQAESGGEAERYVGIEAPWFDGASDRAEGWAVSSGWTPSLG
ncbi:dephospho-CoA kinase [Pseudonocardia abyssalis]|uniref:Dephospho-CoA kinase n=1 Tax=Pseudonocardia abyssalis TaxID=2792008 RepID=A0ABS6UPB5_9PSEU|nr:dephospho-CoA kinase [Pseudonocardia abyssalis]MBW0115238.1 dephospho-CoA kinase [Pseudonocardia abyssalis]MBW0133634.1 dephospho-CoA kinase [Pseudonocardia abyssalis]